MSTSMQRESCCCTSKTKIKKSHILQHCKSPIYQYEIQITGRECRLYSPRALVPWAAASLKPGQARFPGMDCHGAEGAGEDVPGNEPCPMDLACLLPSAGAHNLQIQGVLLQWNYAYCTQRTWGLWAGRALKSPAGSMSPGGGVPTSSPFLGVTPPMDESTLHRVGLQELGFVQGMGRKKERDTGLGCFCWHFPLRQSRNRPFPEALVPPVTKVGHKDTPPCAHFPWQQL